jgi:hypothetical protein
MRAAHIGAPSIGATVQTGMDALIACIESELHAIDERLPSARMLAAEPGVSRNAAPSPLAANTSPREHRVVGGACWSPRHPRICTRLASLGGGITSGKQFFLTGEGPF